MIHDDAELRRRGGRTRHSDTGLPRLNVAVSGHIGGRGMYELLTSVRRSCLERRRNDRQLSPPLVCFPSGPPLRKPKSPHPQARRHNFGVNSFALNVCRPEDLASSAHRHAIITKNPHRALYHLLAGACGRKNKTSQVCGAASYRDA